MIDLRQPREVGEILSACWRLYRAHFRVFATIALAVVVPLDLIGMGLIEGRFHGGYAYGHSSSTASTIIQTLVTVPLITAAHVTAVMEIGEGQEPSAGRALSDAGAVFPTLIATVVLYSLGVLLGCIALILPGIYLAVRWYVSTQAVVAEGASPTEALGRSGVLVQGQWWRVLGFAILVALIGFVVSSPATAVAALADSGPAVLVTRIVVDSVVLSFTALAGTLLFFDLRARL